MTLSVPDSAVLDLQRTPAIHKIPGGGKSVTVDVLNHGRMFGGGADHVYAFDLTLTARTEAGETVTQGVFLYTNG